MNIIGLNGTQYVELKGFEKALGSEIDIMGSLTATDRNYDTIEDFPEDILTKVFLDNTSFLWVFARSIALTYGTTMHFHDNDDKPFEIRLGLTPYGDWEVSAFITATFSKSIDVESKQYKTHMEDTKSVYEKLIGRKICSSSGYVLYDFQTIEDVIEFDAMRYEEMIFDNEGEARIELDVELTEEETEAIRNYFTGYYDKFDNQVTA